MNSHEEVDYRLKLSDGFLKEAEQDFSLKRWRSCVDNAQLCVENAGKAILTLFGVSPKTHEPAKHFSLIINDETIPENIRAIVKDILPEFLALGLEQHFMTDYGDESTYTLPWDLFNEEAASSALNSARLCYSASLRVIDQVIQWRSKELEKDSENS